VTAMQIERIETMALTVADVTRAIAFDEIVLSMEPISFARARFHRRAQVPFPQSVALGDESSGLPGCTSWDIAGGLSTRCSPPTTASAHARLTRVGPIRSRMALARPAVNSGTPYEDLPALASQHRGVPMAGAERALLSVDPSNLIWFIPAQGEPIVRNPLTHSYSSRLRY
jgi:hypothetical protein